VSHDNVGRHYVLLLGSNMRAKPRVQGDKFPPHHGDRHGYDFRFESLDHFWRLGRINDPFWSETAGRTIPVKHAQRTLQFLLSPWEDRALELQGVRDGYWLGEMIARLGCFLAADDLPANHLGCRAIVGELNMRRRRKNSRIFQTCPGYYQIPIDCEVRFEGSFLANGTALIDCVRMLDG